MLRGTDVLTGRIVKRETLSETGACSSRNERDGFELIDVLRDNEWKELEWGYS